MFRVGEETGTLDEQLETAATYYNRELDIRVKRFTSLFEPVVIIFMGLIVGFVAVALVSAMYGIYKQVRIRVGRIFRVSGSRPDGDGLFLRRFPPRGVSAELSRFDREAPKTPARQITGWPGAAGSFMGPSTLGALSAAALHRGVPVGHCRSMRLGEKIGALSMSAGAWRSASILPHERSVRAA